MTSGRHRESERAEALDRMSIDAVLEMVESDVAALRRRIKALESAFHRALKRAQDAREIDDAADLRALARSPTATVFGCALMIRVGAGRGYIQDTMRAARLMLTGAAG